MAEQEMEIRPYETSDGAVVAGWFRQERTMRLWSANRYSHFPLTGEDINAHYDEFRGNPDFSAWMVWENGRPVGHFALLRREFGEVRVLYVVVDNQLRGKEIGQRMMRDCIRYAVTQLEAQTLSLCVFEQNEIARRCYEACGFREAPPHKMVSVMEEQWRCLEMVLEPERGQMR